MLKWELTESAQADLDEIIYNVIAYTGHSSTGIKLINDIVERLDNLAFMPLSGRVRPEPNKREAFCRGYRIVYEISDSMLSVIAIIHTSRLYPRP